MLHMRLLLSAIASTMLLTPFSLADEKSAIPDGNWFLAYRPTMTSGETRLAIFKTETKDGKTTLKTVAGGRSEWSSSNLKIDGTSFSFNVDGPAKLKFEGVLNANNTKTIRGNLGDDSRLFMGMLVATEDDELTAKNSLAPTKLPEAFQEISKLRTAPLVLRSKARVEKDADKKKELLEEAQAADKVAEEKIPAMLAKAVAAEKNSAEGYFGTLDLLGMATKVKLKPENAKTSADAAIQFAASHGPRFEQEAILKIGETMSSQDGLGAVSIQLLESALKKYEKAPAATQIRMYKSLAMAQEKAGKKDEAKSTLAKLDKLDSQADDEYRKTVPPFKPAPVAPRKEGEANKVAVLELFTGAQCPPCVAADVAFDALGKSYSHKDLVLLQYHMHIPGPDPLTNPDSIARWDFYKDKFANGVRGTPTSIFNGSVKAGGGGGMGNAEKKYEQYKEEIDAILKEKSSYTITGTADRVGEKVTAHIKVEMKDKPDADQMLRVLLVEEEVRYVGGNALRLHHHVVRSQFGKKSGVVLKEFKDGAFTASISLDDVRKDLTKYLDEFAAERPFPKPDRPMNMKKLKVIVLIQDDTTAAIAQAAELDVTSK